MKPSKLVVLGASNALREVAGIVHAINQRHHTYEIIGALDDDEAKHGMEIDGIKVLGPISVATSLDSDVQFVFAIGSQSTQLVRGEILKRTQLAIERFPSLIHPKADVDRTAVVGLGCLIHPGACLGPGATVGNFVVIAVNSALGPDSHVDDFALVTSLVLVLSRASIGRNVFVGSMTCVLEDIRIGEKSRVGVSSVVTRDIPPGSVAMGNPARIIARN